MKYDMDSCFNFRDISGYQTTDNKRMKPKMIFRSDHLCDLTPRDIDTLHRLGIKHIIDFRSTEEKEVQPEVPPTGIQYHDLVALHTKDGLENFHFFMLINEHSSVADIERVSSFIREGYDILPFHNAAYQKVFDLMINEQEPLVFHCSAGKDRTGVMGYLIMKLLGIEDVQCMEEYLLSNQYVMDRTVEHAKAVSNDEEVRNKIIEVCTVHETYMQRAIQSIFTKYSSWETFFEKEYGLTKEKRESIKENYLQ